MAAGQVTHISALGGVVCSTRQGRLDRVVISTKGSGSNFLSLYDGKDATGKLLAVIDCTNPVSNPIVYDVILATGLFAFYNGGTPGDLCVVTD